MRISAIVAMAKNGAIGKAGEVPWYLPAELARFKEITMGHPIIMGRSTHESIGRALPGRTNIVITHNKKYSSAGCLTALSIDEALDLAKKSDGADEIFIIGGQSIYQQSMSILDRIYLTEVDSNIAGDKFFKYEPKHWREVSSQEHPADEKNKYAFNFKVLDRL